MVGMGIALRDCHCAQIMRSALAGACLLLLSAEAFAAGGKPATMLVNVADTRQLGAGINKMIADVYNGNLWLYGLMVVVVMAGMGVVLGYVFDRAIGLLGIDLGKLDHHE